MATVVRKPRNRNATALGGLFGALLAGKLQADKREEEERERAEAMARTSALLGGRVSGKGVRDEKSPTNIMGPLLNPGTAPGAPAPRTVQPGEILSSALGAGIKDAQAVALEKMALEAHNARLEERRRKEVAGALRGAVRGLDPEDPRQALVQSIASGRAGAEPGMATALLGQTGSIFPDEAKPGKPFDVEVFDAKGRSKKIAVPSKTAAQGQAAIDSFIAEHTPKGFTTVEPVSAAEGGKPTETQRDVEATRGFLAESNEQFGKLTRSEQSRTARLVLRNQGRASKALDDKFGALRDAQGKLTSFATDDPLTPIIFGAAQSELVKALTDTKGGDPGKAAQLAEERARDPVKTNLPAIGMSVVQSRADVDSFMERAIAEFGLQPKQAQALRQFLEQRFTE